MAGLILAEELSCESCVCTVSGIIFLLLDLCLKFFLLFHAGLLFKLPLPLLFFPPPLLFVGPLPLDLSSLARFLELFFFIDKPLLLLLRFSYDSTLTFNGLRFFAGALRYSFLLSSPPLFVCQTRYFRCRRRDLPPCAKTYSLVALASTSHISVLMNIPCWCRSPLISLSAPAAYIPYRRGRCESIC